jgi:DNA-binding CsgD family transcriptional regulator
MIREEQTIERLRQVASKLTDDPAWQRQLFVEMHTFLSRMRVTEPGLKTIWYVKGCEQHGRSYLRQLKGPDAQPPRDEELIARIDPAAVQPHLSPRQQEVFDHLRAGRGVRETARMLGISHPAVIKLRRKIIRAIERSTPRLAHNGDGAVVETPETLP